MSKKGFVIDLWMKLVGKSTSVLSSALTENGDFAYDSTLDKGILRSNSINDPIVLESRAATLTNKTLDGALIVNSSLDGDDNTITDLSLSSLKTVLADASNFLVRNGSGAVVSNTKAVPTGDVVGTSDSQALSNKTITGGSINSADIDGQTASNTSRITLPKASKSTLDGLTRKQATIVYASDQDTLYFDNGSSLAPLGGNFVTYSNQNVSGGGTVTISLIVGLQMRRITGNGAPVTLANAPFGSSAPADGTVIRLVGQSDTNTVSLVSSDSSKGCLLNGNLILGLGQVLEAQYDSSLDRWLEINRNSF